MLTPAERQIVSYTLDRMSRRETAPPLGLSHSAARQEIQDIYRKLEINSDLELLLYVYSGVLEIPQQQAAVA